MKHLVVVEVNERVWEGMQKLLAPDAGFSLAPYYSVSVDHIDFPAKGFTFVKEDDRRGRETLPGGSRGE